MRDHLARVLQSLNVKNFLVSIPFRSDSILFINFTFSFNPFFLRPSKGYLANNADLDKMLQNAASGQGLSLFANSLAIFL